MLKKIQIQCISGSFIYNQRFYFFFINSSSTDIHEILIRLVSCFKFLWMFLIFHDLNQRFNFIIFFFFRRDVFLISFIKFKLLFFSGSKQKQMVSKKTSMVLGCFKKMFKKYFYFEYCSLSKNKCYCNIYLSRSFIFALYLL